MSIERTRKIVPPNQEGKDAASLTSAFEGIAELQVSKIKGGGEIVWRSWGGGFPLVLIHGGSGSWTHWIRNIESLAQTYRVVVPDIPGLGSSDQINETPTPDRLAQSLAEGLDTLNISSAYAMAGFSFGGLVAGVLGAKRASGLAALALIGPTGLGLPLDHLVDLKRPDFSASAEEEAAIQRHNLLQIMLSKDSSVDALAIYLQRENTIRSRLQSHVFALDDDCARAISRLSCPIVSFWGEKDIAKAHFEARREFFAQLTPGGPFEVIQDAGHWVQYEAAAVFNTIFERWLAQALSAR